MPRAMARSKRPPSLGRSAGARDRVIRRCGYSKPQQSRALRTRSLLSRTLVSGRPTRVSEGRPLARWASTLTAGASTPARARLWISARDMHHSLMTALRFRAEPCGSRLFGALRFQLRHTGFEGFQAGAGAGQHDHLTVELFAADQIELAERALQQGLEVRFQFRVGQGGVAA